MATQVLVRPHVDPFRQRDRRLKTVYPCAVTVCIAAACQDQGEPRIVLCSDTRLDYAEFGSTNVTCKLDVLGHSWCVQMAGHWSGVQEWVRILKRRVQSASAPVTLPEMAEICRWAARKFKQSPLYQSDQIFQLLLSGFDQSIPAIFKASFYPQETRIEASGDFDAIGEGEAIALTLLRQRECHNTMPFSYAAYLAYEAKRASEKCGTVGKFTALAAQAPPEFDDAGRAWLNILGEEGKANLDSLYQTLWRVPFVEVPELKEEWFISLARKQPPE